MDRRRMMVTVLAGGGDVVAPAQPTSLTATPITTSRIDLAWVDVATDETAYKIYRSTDGVSYAQVGTDLAAGTQAYSDTTPDDGVNYYYKVAAVNGGGETLSAAVISNTLLLGLVAYWKLDEESDGSGAVARLDSVGTNHLTDIGTTASAAGVVGNCAAFVNADQTKLQCNSSPSLQTGDIDFTLAAWYYATITQTKAISAKRQVSSPFTREYAIDTGGPSKRPVFYFGALTFQSTATITLSQWNLVIVKHDSVNDLLRVKINNGVEQVSATGGVFGAASDYPFAIGNDPSGATNSPDGFVDAVGKWNRLTTTDEDTLLYNSGGGIQWPF